LEVESGVSSSQTIPTVDLRQFRSGDEAARRRFIDAMGRGLTEFGFFNLEGHGIDAQLISRGYEAFRAFFELDEDVKKRYSGAEASARGYTPFGVEHAKDHDRPDLKEFWQVGREVPVGHPYHDTYPHNVWPEEIPALAESGKAIFRELEECAESLLEAIALFFDLPQRVFADMIDNGNHVLRIIHYPPVNTDSSVPASPDAASSDGEGAVRAAAHEDINLITLLCEATDSGLQLLSREGEWLAVEAQPGQIVVDSGDMIARLTNAVVPATTHRVVNPPSEANRSRYSIPFFVHPFSSCDLTVMEEFVTPQRPARFEPITAGEYLDERLREIGLKS
jgi:isopenicillin N synthase-like dioxygenase